MRSAGMMSGLAVQANPACVISADQSCEHGLVDPELNRRLYEYEQRVRNRFVIIVNVLKTLSAFQHELDLPRRRFIF